MILLKKSIIFLVFVSVYSIVTGHWSAYQSVESEKRTSDMLDEIKMTLKVMQDQYETDYNNSNS